MFSYKRFLCLILLILLGCFLSGCAHYEVLPLPNQHVIALTADDIVIIMNRAGFTKEEIIELGPEVRNALATTGSARTMFDKKTEVVFTTQTNYVYVNSRKRGHFIYDVDTKTIK